MSRSALPLGFVALAVIAAPVLARPGGWGGPGWGPMAPPGPYERARSIPDSREGEVEAQQFLASSANAAMLGRGRIALAEQPGGTTDQRDSATFEAAVIDQLAKAGYDTATAAAASGQVAELRIVRDVVRPEEPPHKPVSGEMEVGVSNRGSMMGMAVNVDLSKPLKALVATRLEARIRDRATNELLWEGRANIVTREGDSHWTTPMIATRLAAALFKDFPGHS